MVPSPASPMLICFIRKKRRRNIAETPLDCKAAFGPLRLENQNGSHKQVPFARVLRVCNLRGLLETNSVNEPLDIASRARAVSGAWIIGLPVVLVFLLAVFE